MYCKLIDNQVIEAPINDLERGIMNYNLDTDLLIQDGWKLFVPATKPSEEEIRMYHVEYTETDTINEIIVYDETQKEAEERIAEMEKADRIGYIDMRIDELERMATYEILFNNKENIKIYQDVIKGLEDTKNNL